MASDYTIVNQREVPDITLDGRFHRFIEVTFQTPEGHVGSVKIPEERYTAEYVDAQVAEQAATMRAIAQL